MIAGNYIKLKPKHEICIASFYAIKHLIPFDQKFKHFLENQKQTIFTPSQLSQLLLDFSKAINFELGASEEDWINNLASKKIINVIFITMDAKKKYVYSLDQPTAYQVACIFQNDSYISHASAAYLQKIYDIEPNSTYVSTPSRIRENEGHNINQGDIDRAFQKKQRQSKNYWIYQKREFLYLESRPISNDYFVTIKNVKLTTIEKTLLDMTVRPFYGGGPVKIQEAYRKAVDSISIEKLTLLLEKMQYQYLYHQSLGFYLSQAGIDSQKLAQLKAKGLRNTFYLDYEMNEPLYSKEWNIFYPKQLDSLK